MKLQTIKSQKMSTIDFQKCINQLIEMTKSFPIIPPKYKHVFSNGLYVREARITKGTLVIGMIHKKETVAILAEGSMKNLTEKGVVTISAYKMLVTPPGMQRVSFALTDVTFMTLHRTDSETVDDFEDEWVMGGHKYVLGGDKNLQSIENRRLYEGDKSNNIRYLI
jgi:hypothetical protein